MLDSLQAHNLSLQPLWGEIDPDCLGICAVDGSFDPEVPKWDII